MTACGEDEPVIVSVSGVSLTKTTVTITVGGIEQLVPIVMPTNASDPSLIWVSDNTGVATIDDGVVTAVAIGTATITVTTVDGGATATCAVTVVERQFPDDKFREILVADYGLVLTNGDIDPENTTNKARFAAITKLTLNEKGIASLKGVEYFTQLTELSCNTNQLTTLSLTTNKLLTELQCSDNQLTDLDISTNTALISVMCYQNPLATLNVSANTNLTHLLCGTSPLTALDVTANTKLQRLDCDNCQLTTLDLSKNSALWQLFCNGNQLQTLALANNTNLKELCCSSNQLATLDLRILPSVNFSALQCGKQSGSLLLRVTAEQYARWQSESQSDPDNLNVSPFIGYRMGDPYPNSKNPIGVVCYVEPSDANHGKIFSLDEPIANWNGLGNAAGKLYWSSESIVTGATEPDDGPGNNAKIKALPTYSASTYPAVAWCAAKGEGWYLPAVGDFQGLSKEADREAIYAGLASIGATPLTKYVYLTSFESTKDPALVFHANLNTFAAYSSPKTIAYYVRAVKAF